MVGGPPVCDGQWLRVHAVRLPPTPRVGHSPETNPKPPSEEEIEAAEQKAMEAIRKRLEQEENVRSWKKTTWPCSSPNCPKKIGRHSRRGQQISQQKISPIA
ncbi:MAG: hypothetical protein Ct9H300mP8_05300 [Gammaproteobacteria bacterium]|nr:MAG: hypothetical protein Ct9H300mP8_05300 [Gammaproteobacteria bacterium]